MRLASDSKRSPDERSDIRDASHSEEFGPASRFAHAGYLLRPADKSEKFPPPHAGIVAAQTRVWIEACASSRLTSPDAPPATCAASPASARASGRPSRESATAARQGTSTAWNKRCGNPVA